MATLFVFSGLEKIFKYPEVCAFAAAAGVPLASALMPCAILLELGCAALLLTRQNDAPHLSKTAPGGSVLGVAARASGRPKPVPVIFSTRGSAER